jgi:hypothetical protein
MTLGTFFLQKIIILGKKTKCVKFGFLIRFCALFYKTDPGGGE